VVTPNVSFALLDAAVIAGRAEEPLLMAGERTWSHARMLEEVAALGGVLRHLGVSRGVPCVIDLRDDTDAVVAALATARLGGVVTTQDDPEAPVVVATEGSEVPVGERVRLLRGADGEVAEPDLDWVVMIRAGRTDPAAAEVLDPGSAYSSTRTVAEQTALLEAAPAPHRAEDLRALLDV
jgi:acyl-CoA synthetase (AMP-forming)/AMP-acid ligase II